MWREGGRAQASFKKIALFIVLLDILSIVLRSCPSTALGRKNFGCSILDSYFSILFSSPFPFTVFFSKTSKTELWMVDLGFLLFSSHFPFKASFRKPAISTSDGKLLGSYFSNAIFLLKFLFKQLQE